MAGPIILIALGVIFLLNNLGIVDVNIWAVLARWWPLILIAIGVELLLGNRRRGATGVAVLIVGILVVIGLSLVVPQQEPAGTHTIAQTLDEAERAEIKLVVPVAALRIDGQATADMLIEGTVETRRNEVLSQDFQVRDGVAHYRLESRAPGVGVPTIGRDERVRWELALTPDVPLELDIDTGVGEVELELSQLNLRRLKLDTGVGRTSVTLPPSELLQSEISTGVGETTVRIPSGVAARVTVSRGLGGVTVRGDLERDGDVYESPDYETATHRLDLRLSTGVGSVTVDVAQ